MRGIDKSEVDCNLIFVVYRLALEFDGKARCRQTRENSEMANWSSRSQAVGVLEWNGVIQLKGSIFGSTR